MATPTASATASYEAGRGFPPELLHVMEGSLKTSQLWSG